MKQIFLFLFLFLFLSIGISLAGDTIKTPKPYTLNSSTYTAIVVGSQACYGYTIIKSDSTQIYIAIDAAGTGAFLTPVGLISISYTDYVSR